MENKKRTSEEARKYYQEQYNPILETMQPNSQPYTILKHLIERRRITAWEAIEKYHITRLSAIIVRLRQNGVKIKSTYVSNKDERGKTVSYSVYEIK